jgi:hypothetical protein
MTEAVRSDEQAPAANSSKPPKRLNMNLPARVYDELQELADEEGKSMTVLVRESLGLLKLIYDETRSGNQLAILGPDKNVLRELFLLR